MACCKSLATVSFGLGASAALGYFASPVFKDTVNQGANKLSELCSDSQYCKRYSESAIDFFQNVAVPTIKAWSNTAFEKAGALIHDADDRASEYFAVSSERNGVYVGILAAFTVVAGTVLISKACRCCRQKL